MKPTKEHMDRIMEMLQANGVVIFVFDHGEMHMNVSAKNSALAEQLDRIGTAFGRGVVNVLQEENAAKIAETFKFDPHKDPNYRPWT
jgi:hypothetical protein